MRSKPHVRLPALILLALFGVTVAGLPSHHHQTDVEGASLRDGQHHHHGVQLLDQAERLTTPLGVSVALPATLSVPSWAFIARADSGPSAWRPAPRDRASPSARPRAPPLPI